MTHSKRRTARGKGRKAKDPRPKKPKDHPCYPHRNGYWCKKVRGKNCYFGRWKDDPTGQRARELWAEQKDDLLAGRLPKAKTGETTVADAVNYFLSVKKSRVKSRELRQSTWDEYNKVCGVIVQVFGRNRLVSDLDALDFEQLRATFAESCGPVRLAKLVQITRSVFKLAYDDGKIPEPTRFGQGFKRPSKSVLRCHRAQQGQKMFTPAEIQSLLAKASPTMKAFVLLGVNAGLGNADCGRLEFGHLDLTPKDGWGMLDYPRGKTGIDRKACLWPETRQAIEEAIQERREPLDPSHSELVFITKYGKPWFKETTDNPVSRQFAKLLREAKVKGKGKTFYALRHTSRTVMDETRDFPAADLVMGHATDSMADRYRERIDPSRLRELAEHLRAWLWPETAETKREDQQQSLRIVG